MKTMNDTLLVSPTEISPWTSLAQHVGNSAAYAIQVKCLSGSVTITLECSSDEGDPESPVEARRGLGVVHWTVITGASQVLAAGDDVTFDASELGYKWVRVVSTGVGVIESARINTKGF